MYADDMMLVAKNKNGLQEWQTAWGENMKEYRLKVNINKRDK